MPSRVQNEVFSKFKDPKTLKLMTLAEVKKHKDYCDEVVSMLKTWRDLLKEEAQRPETIYNDIFWQEVIVDGHIIFLEVTCPSAADHQESKENE